jgi:RNA polymerase sigma-70 factor, ECF subfamily
MSSKSEFIENYKNTVDKTYKYIIFRVSNKEDAQDILQETYLQALKSWDVFRGNSSFQTWVIAISKNLLKKYYQNKYKLNSMQYENWMDKFYKDSPEEDVTNRSQIDNKEKRVIEILSKLENKYKQVMLLRFVKNYKIREIAEELHISVQNVKVIQHRAIKKLKLELLDQ